MPASIMPPPPPSPGGNKNEIKIKGGRTYIVLYPGYNFIIIIIYIDLYSLFYPVVLTENGEERK